MKHVSLNVQDDAVKRFVMSLAVDAEGSVLELDGRPVAQVLPVQPQRNGTSIGDEE